MGLKLTIVMAVILLGVILIVTVATGEKIQLPFLNALFFTQTATTSVTVNTFVETSITNSSATFGSLDPGTTDNNATTNPTQITNTANSNTAVDIYLQATNLTDNGNQIAVSNLVVRQETGGDSATFVASPSFINGTIANTGYFENVAVSSTTNFLFALSVPSGQASGTYTGNVTLKSVQDGTTP